MVKARDVAARCGHDAAGTRRLRDSYRGLYDRGRGRHVGSAPLERVRVENWRDVRTGLARPLDG